MRVPSMDWSELQRWQTLMAAIVALAAAGLTYRGAMAKVRIDQESERKDEHRRKLGLLRQLQFIAESLREDSAELRNIWRGTGPDAPPNFSWLALKQPPELSTAWDNLDALPDQAGIAINLLRFFFARYELVLENLKDGTVDLPQSRDQAEALLANMAEHADELLEAVQAELRALGMAK